MTTQHGYLVLADISGYTAYVAGTELEHAQEILTELLEVIVGQFKTLLTISKLEGDAVFAYVSKDKVARGETLLELIESTYVAFRDRRDAAHRRTTCDCNACRAIPTLDLKFFAHHGDYFIQQVAGVKELVGSDVNLIHRLMKNHVSEATGWKAYALFTERGLEHLEVRPAGLHPQPETYEHLGDVQTYSLNLHPRYTEIVDARRLMVQPESAHGKIVLDLPAPPPTVWQWLNDPQKKLRWEDLETRAISRPGGRTTTGARNHCVHGKNVEQIETVLDWRPFDYFTIERKPPNAPLAFNITYRLEPAADSRTRVGVYATLQAPLPGFLRAPLCRLFMRARGIYKFHAELARLVEEEAAQDQGNRER